MKIGTTFPQLDLSDDPDALRDYAVRVEAAGYDHLLAPDHVVGVDPDRDWDGPYDNADPFHEPLTTLGHVAAHTDELSYVTGILILPQRQTALVAKQAAQIDLFSGGRLHLGVAVGWNPYEYRALGEDFSVRGRRIEEQVEVLRKLWTEPVVDFEGEFHELPGVGINPRPVQQPIPIWMGGMAEPVKRRVGRMADGWLPQVQPGEGAEAEIADVYDHVEAAGRDPDEIAVYGRLSVTPGEEGEWIEGAQAWRDLGADYLGAYPRSGEFDGPGDRLDHLERVAETLREAGLL